MELVNDFTVNAPIDEAWATLTDLERIAPCMPGAQLTEIEGDSYRGHVKIKVGPIQAQFKGQAHFVERDEVNHRAALKAEGRDTGGKGNASAVITALLVAEGERSTKVTVTTDLTITGKVAQFGRGALADVSDKLLKQFVHNLETTVLGQSTSSESAAAGVVENVTTPAAESPAEADSAATPAEQTAASAWAAPAAPTVRKIDSKPAEPIDLLETAGAPMLKRLVPIGIALVVLLFLLRRRRG
jgi:uncharacterized protein